MSVCESSEFTPVVVPDVDPILPQLPEPDAWRWRQYPKSLSAICGGVLITISGLMFVLSGVAWAAYPLSEFSIGYGIWSAVTLMAAGVTAVLAATCPKRRTVLASGMTSVLALCVAVPTILIFSAEGFISGENGDGMHDHTGTGYIAAQSVMLVYVTFGGAAAICCIAATMRALSKVPRPSREVDMPPDDRFNVGGAIHGLFNPGFEPGSPPSYDIICPPPAYMESPTSTEIPHVHNARMYRGNESVLPPLPPYERLAPAYMAEVTSGESPGTRDGAPEYCMHNTDVPLHRSDPEGKSEQDEGEAVTSENETYVPTLNMLRMDDPITNQTSGDLPLGGMTCQDECQSQQHIHMTNMPN